MRIATLAISRNMLALVPGYGCPQAVLRLRLPSRRTVACLGYYRPYLSGADN
jgi:hypothetical protein